jgi:hypothetical protein
MHRTVENLEALLAWKCTGAKDFVHVFVDTVEAAPAVSEATVLKV